MPMEQTRGLFCTCDSLVTTPVSLLANKFDVRSVLHGQASLAAINQMCVIHEAMNGCKKSKDSFKATFENENIFPMNT